MAGQAPAASAPAATETPRASATQGIRAAGQVESATAAEKLPRPGSIIDIWV